MLHHPITDTAPVRTVENRITAALGLGAAILHRVDFDDLFLSEAAMKALHHIGEMIVKHYQTKSRAGKSRFSLESLTMRAHFIEDTGDLVVSAQFGDDIHCIQVPERHWSMRNGTFH